MKTVEIPIPEKLYNKLGYFAENHLEGKITVDALANCILSYVFRHKNLLNEVVAKAKEKSK